MNKTYLELADVVNAMTFAGLKNETIVEVLQQFINSTPMKEDDYTNFDDMRDCIKGMETFTYTNERGIVEYKVNIQSKSCGEISLTGELSDAERCEIGAL